VFNAEQNLVGILAAMLAIFYCHLGKHTMHCRIMWIQDVIYKTRTT